MTPDTDPTTATATAVAPAEPVAPPDLATALRTVLAESPAPLPFAAVVKGLKKLGVKPRKKQAAEEFEAEVRQALADDVGAGRAFLQPSGPERAERFWGRDEAAAVRAAVLALAAQPKPLAALLAAAGKAVKGADQAFVGEVVNGLVGGNTLFAHSVKGEQRYGAFAPVPPLEQPKFRKKLEAVLKSVSGLMADAQVPLEDVLAAVRTHVAELAAAAPAECPAVPAPAAEPEVAELDALILKAVTEAGPGSVVALADLRAQMPAEYAGPAFDAVVLQLAEAGTVRLSEGDPTVPTSGSVTGGDGRVFTTIAIAG